MTGSAHDAWAFEHTAAAKYPDWFFQGEEFAWADSAYGISQGPFLSTRSLLHYSLKMLHLTMLLPTFGFALNIAWVH